MFMSLASSIIRIFCAVDTANGSDGDDEDGDFEHGSSINWWLSIVDVGKYIEAPFSLVIIDCCMVL